VVVDVGSTYGTYVDGARIPPNQRYRLQMGSVVSLAKALEFKIVPAGSDTAY
jgi:pSer/pThr/pTyr-binding forkhead associated (FHA) protein